MLNSPLTFQKSRSPGESMAHFVCKYKVQEPIEEPNVEEFGNGYKKR